ncbi:MAG: hypothetical protein IPJ88_06375 [Myxococcales bacterium]|nr:MAG: hypothetical protein IPJ88_06375 [Myxococcales bacterium]
MIKNGREINDEFAPAEVIAAYPSWKRKRVRLARNFAFQWPMKLMTARCGQKEVRDGS